MNFKQSSAKRQHTITIVIFLLSKLVVFHVCKNCMLLYSGLVRILGHNDIWSIFIKCSSLVEKQRINISNVLPSNVSLKAQIPMWNLLASVENLEIFNLIHMDDFFLKKQHPSKQQQKQKSKPKPIKLLQSYLLCVNLLLSSVHPYSDLGSLIPNT